MKTLFLDDFISENSNNVESAADDWMDTIEQYKGEKMSVIGKFSSEIPDVGIDNSPRFKNILKFLGSLSCAGIDAHGYMFAIQTTKKINKGMVRDRFDGKLVRVRGVFKGSFEFSCSCCNELNWFSVIDIERLADIETSVTNDK